MLRLDFEGWFECRLATDPDPADEPRGVSGWSFAVGPEPDFDRIIRFHDPVCRRLHAPEVGVRVVHVQLNGTGRADHALMGAKVELLGEPRFEGRNGLIAEDGQEPVHPFDLQVSGKGITLRRADPLDGRDSPIHLVDPDTLQRRLGGGLEIGNPDVPAATGITDAEAFLWKRAEQLEGAKQAERHPVERAALQTRIWALEDGDTQRKRLAGLRGRVSYVFAIGEHGGQATVEGDPDRIGGDPDLRKPWPVTFWLGGWDSDALCAYAKGTLVVPFTT